MPSMVSYPCRLQSGPITCYLNRTYHGLTTPAKLFLDRQHCDMINQPVPNWSAFHTGRQVIRGSGDLSVRGLNEQGSAQPACSHALRAGPFCKLFRERKHMRSLTTFFVLLVVFMVPSSLAHAQGTEPASKTDGSASVAATKEEVNQLRSEVAAQRQTIEELKVLVEKLAAGQALASESSSVQIRPVADAASVEANALPGNAPGQGTEM